LWSRLGGRYEELTTAAGRRLAEAGSAIKGALPFSKEVR